MPRNPYKHKSWLRFRSEVIELDGNACVNCRKKEKEGAILQVHHKRYIQGQLPWEYPYRYCETLCKGCHAEKHGMIIPRYGWAYLFDEDLEELSGTCDYCGNNIRYVFHIHHPHWEPMAVGTICCDKLTGTELASHNVESIRRHENRKKRFVSSRRWKREGRELRITQKGIQVRIVPFCGRFKIFIDRIKGSKIYRSIEEAQGRVFDFIESGDAEAYIRKIRRLTR